jgi:uncharacterized membrane protein
MSSTAGAEDRPWLSELVASTLVLTAVGASVAAALWFAGYDHLTPFLRRNEMPPPVRAQLITAVLVGAAAGGVGAIGYAAWRRTGAALRRLHRLARVLSPLSLCFALPLLLDGRGYRGNALLFCIAAAGFGLCLERSLRLSFEAVSWDRPAQLVARLRGAYPRAWRLAPPLLVAAMALALAVYTSVYGVMHHYRLQTRALDLAIFDNLMWNLLRGEWYRLSPDLGGGYHIQTHASFGAILLAPLYGLRQQADTLIVIQATLCSLAVVPIYLLARRRLGTAWLALACAYGYVVYAPLHGPLFYDFHFLTLAPFFVAWVLYLFETGRRGWLILAWLVAISMREELSAGVAMACLFYLLSGRRVVWALVGGVVSAGYFVLAKFVIMPAFQQRGAPVASFDWLYGALRPKHERGFDAVLRTVLTNPIFTFKTVLTEGRATYLLQLLGPVLLLPLRHRRAWLLVLAPALFTVLATAVPALHSIRFQYAAHWAAYVFIAAAIALSAWQRQPGGRIRVAAAAVALCVVSTVFSHQYGALFHRSTFEGGFTRVRFRVTERDHRRHAELYRLIAHIPPEASVAATETEAPHVSGRRGYRTLRYGHAHADYLLVRLEEAIERKETRSQLLAALDSGRYGLVDATREFALWGKGHDQSRNAEGDVLLERTPPGAQRLGPAPSRRPAR